MAFVEEFKAGFRAVTRGSRVVSSSLSLWLWLYVAVTMLSAASVLSPSIALSAAVGRDPYLWSGRVAPWIEPIFYRASEHAWLGISSLIALFASWLFGLFVYAGVAGAVHWRRQPEESGEKKARGPFGSAGLRFFGTSLFYHLMIDLVLVVIAALVWVAVKFAAPWAYLVVAFLGLLWLGCLFFWRALALSVRVRGHSLRRSFSSSAGFIWRHPIKVIGALLPLFFNAVILSVGLTLLLRYSMIGGVWLFLLQQTWVIAYLGHKLLLQATADAWAFPESEEPAQA